MLNNILGYLEANAQKLPNKIAIIEEDKTITYKELLNKSRQIATALVEFSIYREPVGVYMEKGINALITFFGIAYAGGCYAVLNTELPDARIKQIQTVSKTKIIVTVPEFQQKVQDLFPDVKILIFDDIINTSVNENVLTEVRERFIDTNPLYINFTSGSTGVPKGIVVAHRSVIDFMECFTDIFGITADDVVANQAPFDFDVSVKDIYSSLKTGATLLVVPRKLFSAPTNLIDYLCDNNVTTMIWAVSALCLISTFHGLDYKTPATVNKILFSGEVMPYKHLCEWQKHLPDAMYVNLYGPTEITCNCTYHILEKGRDYSENIPIGKHFPNEDVFLFNGTEEICQKDVVGDIFVRGTALALGYYYLPEKNSESFIQNPLNDAYPEIVYKTGDLGKYNSNGELVFCGRADFQVKYMGHRIELEEIERNISSIEGVERCCCIFDEAKSKLRGYYVGTIEKKELHSYLKANMPIFMVPGYLRKIEAMPLTKNGKINRKELLENN